MDAVGFAMTVQLDLLTLDWPPELLAQDICAPVVVALHSMTSIAGQLWPAMPGAGGLPPAGGGVGGTAAGGMSASTLLQHATSINGEVFGSSLPALVRRDSTLGTSASQHGVRVMDREERESVHGGPAAATSGGLGPSKRSGNQTLVQRTASAAESYGAPSTVGASSHLPHFSGASHVAPSVVSSVSAHGGGAYYGWLDKKSSTTIHTIHRSVDSSHRGTRSSVGSSMDASMHGAAAAYSMGSSVVLAQIGRMGAGMRAGQTGYASQTPYPGVSAAGAVGPTGAAARATGSPVRSRHALPLATLPQQEPSPAAAYVVPIQDQSGGSGGGRSLHDEASLKNGQLRGGSGSQRQVASGHHTTVSGASSGLAVTELRHSCHFSPVLPARAASPEGRTTPMLTLPHEGGGADSDEELADSLYAPNLKSRPRRALSTQEGLSDAAAYGPSLAGSQSFACGAAPHGMTASLTTSPDHRLPITSSPKQSHVQPLVPAHASLQAATASPPADMSALPLVLSDPEHQQVAAPAGMWRAHSTIHSYDHSDSQEASSHSGVSYLPKLKGSLRHKILEVCALTV